jgi:hypothetical protein
MNYICIENKEIIGVFNYQPAVPESVTVVEITDEEAASIKNGTHFFDVDNTVKSKPLEEINAAIEEKQQEISNSENRLFLSSTDWKVLRHIRQLALEIPTSLTAEQYLELENQRQNAANSIINP